MMKVRTSGSVVSLLLILLATSVAIPPYRQGNVAFAASDIFTPILRRAAQHVEAMRGSKMAPGWTGATLVAKPRPLYRPDVRGVAYYEFQVLNLRGGPAGFIILSAGRHDFPLAHWDYRGLPPSHKLALEAQQADKRAVRFYKLDTLHYSAEDRAGELVASTDTQLLKISGQDPSVVGTPLRLTSETWTPSGDTERRPGKHEIKRFGPRPSADIKLDGWESWKELKAGFGESYATMIRSLAFQADHDWQIERAAAKFGEGLHASECLVVIALEDEFEVTLAGAGAKYATAKPRTRRNLPPVIDLCAGGADPKDTLPFTLSINYSDRPDELLPYAVISEADSMQSAPSAEAGAESAWGPWTYYWAGSSSQQRFYDQMEESDPINTSSCYSGCGATAWSMLFGWADYQASIDNSYWAPRWGLYRVNGGTGSNAVAPQFWDTGVKNMMWEVRNDIDTFCILDSGATFPWDMDEASGYLSGRTGTTLSTHYNSVGIHEDSLREYARNSIRDRDTPAIIGTGWLEHYPLAWGYAWQSRTVNYVFWQTTEYNRWFYVNQGWGGSGDGWVSASTWFSGEIYP